MKKQLLKHILCLCTTITCVGLFPGTSPNTSSISLLKNITPDAEMKSETENNSEQNMEPGIIPQNDKDPSVEEK